MIARALEFAPCLERGKVKLPRFWWLRCHFARAPKIRTTTARLGARELVITERLA